MEKQAKILIVIVSISVLASVLIPTSMNWFMTGGYGLEEEGGYFKVGTVIPIFHFHGLQPNTQHRFQMWHPTQDYHDDSPDWVYYFSSDSSGNHNWDIDLYLDHDGDYMCNLDWKCSGWCTVFGGGRIHSDGYRADIDITAFTANPSTVEVGDTITVSWTVKNNGEFNGCFNWEMGTTWNCDSARNNLGSGFDIVLNIGQTYSDTLAFTVTEHMVFDAHPNEILVVLGTNFYGSDTQYSPDWYTVWGNNNEDIDCKSIAYTAPLEPPDVDITYTVSILTTPNNCDVYIPGVETENSGNDGIVTFANIPYGTCNIVVSRTGYPSSTKTVFVNSDMATALDLTSQVHVAPILFLISILILCATIYYVKKK